MTLERAPWKTRVQEVWHYATAAISVLFFVTVLVGWFVTWQAGGKSLFSYVLAAADPALASIGMVCVCLAAPDVFIGPRFRLPHTVTLPTIYLAIVYGIKSLARDSSEAVRGIEGARRFDLIWLDLRVVIEAWIVLVLVMAVISVVTTKRDGVE